jgi:hypothetical protein
MIHRPLTHSCPRVVGVSTALANPDVLPESELPPLDAELMAAFQSQARFVVAVSLSEAETLRLILHTNQAALAWAGVALRTADGAVIEASRRFSAAPAMPEQEAFVDTCVQCLRFFNNEMCVMNQGPLLPSRVN